MVISRKKFVGGMKKTRTAFAVLVFFLRYQVLSSFDFVSGIIFARFFFFDEGQEYCRANVKIRGWEWSVGVMSCKGVISRFKTYVYNTAIVRPCHFGLTGN
jgi:hypothetical protein